MTNARVMQVATSLNSALANYDNRSVTAEKYYNKTEIDGFNTYSTEEKVVGTWIDGKPIYRRVITKTEIGQTITIATGIETLVNGFLLASGLGSDYMFNILQINPSNINCVTYSFHTGLIENNLIVTIYMSRTITLKGWLEYTKSTN